jgi:hypothetical protein
MLSGCTRETAARVRIIAARVRITAVRVRIIAARVRIILRTRHGGSSPRHASEAGRVPRCMISRLKPKPGAVQGALTRMRWRRARSGRGGGVDAVFRRRRERCTIEQRVSASHWSSARIGYSAYPDGPLRLVLRRTLLALSHGGTLSTECPPWGYAGYSHGVT